MGTKSLVILVACLLFCIAYEGSAHAPGAACRTSDLAVSTDTYPDPGGRPEYFVRVANTCACTQRNIKLACPGYNSSIVVYPASAITPDGDGMLCTLVGGGPVEHGGEVYFYYEWSTKFSFEPVSSKVDC
uniref:Uncharacterized protein n=1 Tax=Avena sativa TaxID=4498 RepID=A0ACD5Z9P8_AVESA